eukprot:sb/3477882/
MIGDSSDPSAQFIFCGVVDVANALCSSAQGNDWFCVLNCLFCLRSILTFNCTTEYEVLATEDARKVFNGIKETTLCLDWGEKNEYEVMKSSCFQSVALHFQPDPF